MKYYSFLLILLFISCSKEKKDPIKFSTDSFNSTKELTLINSFQFTNFAYFNLHPIDEDRFLCTLHSEKHRFAIVDKNFNVLEYVLNRDEEIHVPLNSANLNNITRQDSILKVIFNDLNRNTFLEYQIKINDEFPFEFVKKTDFSNLNSHVGVFFEVDNGYIVSQTNLNNELDLLRLYDYEHDLIDQITLDKKPEIEDLGHIWYKFNPTFGRYVIHVEDNKFLVVFTSTKELYLIDDQLNVLNKINTPFSSIEINELINNQTKPKFLRNPKIINKHIIIPYFEEDTPKNNNNVELLIYDLQLNPKHKIKLDHGLTSFTTSIDNKKLYVIDFNEEKTYVYDAHDLFLNN